MKLLLKTSSVIYLNKDAKRNIVGKVEWPVEDIQPFIGSSQIDSAPVRVGTTIEEKTFKVLTSIYVIR
jgi:hypothetical protein